MEAMIVDNAHSIPIHLANQNIAHSAQMEKNQIQEELVAYKYLFLFTAFFTFFVLFTFTAFFAFFTYVIFKASQTMLYFTIAFGTRFHEAVKNSFANTTLYWMIYPTPLARIIVVCF
jgi:hypothetical protein